MPDNYGYLGTDKKWRERADSINLYETAEETKKQTEIIEEAEEKRTRLLEKQIEDEKYNNIMNKIEEDRKRLNEEIYEEEQYEYRRNQKIFDKINIDYNIVNEFFELLENIKYKIDKGYKINTYNIECEKEKKESNLNRAISDVKIIENNIKENSNIFIKNLIILSILGFLKSIVSGTIFDIFIVLALGFFIFAITTNLYHIFNEKIKLRIYKKEQVDAKKELEYYCYKYENDFKKQIVSREEEAKMKFEVLKNRYNNILKDWKNFRFEHYNVEFENALKLIRIRDNNKFEQDKGTKQEYEIFLEDKTEEVYKIDNELSEFIESIQNIQIERKREVEKLKCPNCGNDLKETTKGYFSCKICSQEQNDNATVSNKQKIAISILMIMAVVLVIACIIAYKAELVSLFNM